MFQVMLKNVQKSGNRRDSTVSWLRVQWPIQQRCGLSSIKFWNGSDKETSALYCRYTLENFD